MNTIATLRPALAKYGAFASVAARLTGHQRFAMIGRVVFLGLLLAVFSRLWDAVLAGGAYAELNARDMVWYLAATEWVVLAVPLIHLDVESAVRNGDLAYRLPRPMSYFLSVMAEGMGQLAVRLPVLGVAAFGFAFAMSGGLPQHSGGLMLAIPLGVMAAVLCLLMHVAIGMTALWLGDVSPVFWAWQKLSFILGGLIFPLEIYPEWLQTAAAFTPFEPMVHGVGQTAFGFNLAAAGRTALALILWGGVTLGASLWFYRRALRSLHVNGG